MSAARSLRLAVVRQRYTPHGGAERFVERALGSLAGRGAEVSILARGWESGGATRITVVDPFYVGRLWRDAGFARAARAAWQAGRFDLVQSHERIPGCEIYRAGDGVHRQWLANRRVYATPLQRLGLALSPYHRYVCAAERAMFEHPRLRAVICNSRMVRDEILRHFRVAPEKLHVIYNGVDTTHYHPLERAAHRERERARLGVATHETLLAFVGSGFARKGLETLLAAMGAAGGALRLVVVGRDRELPRFVAQSRNAGLSERVSFVGGVEDVRPYYAAADALVLPTHYDPFPNVVPEALAMGIPAIVSDQCGAAEIIVDGESGYVCRAGDTQALADLLRGLSGMADRSRLEAGARRAIEPLSLDAMTSRLLQLYAKLSP